MRIRKRWLIIALVVILGIAMILGLRHIPPQNAGNNDVEPSAVAPAIGWKTYSSSSLGLEFQYPDTYLLTEGNVLPPSRVELRLLPSASSSSSLISIRVMEDPDHMPADEWVKTFSPDYRNSSGLLTSTTISGVEGVIYRVFGDTLNADEAFAQKGDFMYNFMAQYKDLENPIRVDYGRILNTIKF